MSESHQFYADNEKDDANTPLSEIDLSMAYEIKSRAIPEEEWENQEIVFYCHNCETLVSVKKREEKNTKFVCQECDGESISFGTDKSIRGYFRIGEGKKEGKK
ncbi:hypothetical protein IPN35_05745 [Candidatus Peregrinibacteria bacterium]|nr:MAG: hypothetical protein IPN35_05745 [Candidatus Peregrinibacteria bacterium]